MKTTVRSERRGRSGARGFTLIELLVAIAIMAVIAVLSWRGLDQIIRGRQTITNAMEDERVFAQLFDQMRIDARQAATDDESGQAAVSVSGNVLQIVRRDELPGTAPRLQVVRYRVAEGTGDPVCVAAVGECGRVARGVARWRGRGMECGAFDGRCRVDFCAAVCAEGRLDHADEGCAELRLRRLIITEGSPARECAAAAVGDGA